ncbi:hypothetical protein HPB47_022072, partial [Ixodes persulcatus]
MTKTQDVCGRCSKTINGRQQYIACSGTCNRRFHCRCVNIAAAEYELLVQNGVSTYECQECTKLPGLDSAKLGSDDAKNNLTRRKDFETTQTSERSSFSFAGRLMFSHLKYRPCEQTMNSYTFNLPVMRNSFTYQLRVHASDHYDWWRHASRETSTPLPVWNRAPNLEHGDPLVASTTGIRGSRSTTDEDGYTLVQKKRRVKPATGTNSTSKLTAVPRPPRSRALFVSRLDPTTTVDDIAAILSN